MNEPHGSRLVDRRISSERADRVRTEIQESPIIALDHPHLCDLLNIADGRYSPLTGFLSRNDFMKVLADTTLEDGTVWPLPVTLDVSAEVADSLKPDARVGMEGPDGELVGYLDVEDVYRYNTERTCVELFDTTDDDHPGVRLVESKGPFLVGGDIGVFPSVSHPHREYALTPAETRVLFTKQGWETVAGFQTRNVPHRAHEYLQKSTLEHVDGLFIHPKIGEKKPGDYTDQTIIEAYDTLIGEYYPGGSVAFGIFPSRMWYGGPREAIFDAIVRKNHGCTHMIIGRDHAGVGDFYGDFASQDAFEENSQLGITPVFYHYAFYCEECHGMASEKTCPHDTAHRIEPSGTELRRKFDDGTPPSKALMRPEVFERVYQSDTLFVE